MNYFKSLFIDTWANAEKNSIEKNSIFTQKFVNISTIVILVYIAVGLSIVKYYGQADYMLPFLNLESPNSFSVWFCSFFYGSEIGVFHQKIWWVGSIVLVYLIIPVLIIKFGFKQKLSDYGLTINNVHKDYPLYLLMLFVMLPIVYFASTTTAFQQRYPIFQPTELPLFPVFIWWQIVYFVQFIAVEFFFRGFIIHGLKHRFGFYSVFISTIPYCLVHFGKPFGETIAAIFAGIVLGTLSLKSRSIVLGILIHYSVAITMDLFALYREGIL